MWRVLVSHSRSHHCDLYYDHCESLSVWSAAHCQWPFDRTSTQERQQDKTTIMKNAMWSGMTPAYKGINLATPVSKWSQQSERSVRSCNGRDCSAEHTKAQLEYNVHMSTNTRVCLGLSATHITTGDVFESYLNQITKMAMYLNSIWKKWQWIGNL